MWDRRVVISTECCTFKSLNSHMLIPYCCYLFNFVLFSCFRVLYDRCKNSCGN